MIVFVLVIVAFIFCCCICKVNSSPYDRKKDDEEFIKYMQNKSKDKKPEIVNEEFKNFIDKRFTKVM